MNKSPMLHNLTLMNAAKPEKRYTGGDFAAWQKETRARLSSLLGMDTILKNKPEGDTFALEYEKKEATYIEYRFTLSSEVGYTFPCVLRIPSNVSRPMPLMICLQGHSTGMHISLGKPIYPGDEAMIAGGDRDFAVRAVKEGFAALCIEQRNFGECGAKENGETNCHVSSMTALLLGRTTIGERVADVSCAIDAALTHFDCFDKEKLILMGNSGGGTATVYAACLDERIAFAMPSCAVCTYRHSIAAMEHCVCNFIPGIANELDMGDLAGLIAPRRLLIVNGKDDPIFPDVGVRESYEIAKGLYAVAGVPERVALVTGDGGHRFYANDAYPILREMLKG